MLAIVTCEHCKHRQEVARRIYSPEIFYMVCKDCEHSLRVEVTDEHIAKAARQRHKVLT